MEFKLNITDKGVEVIDQDQELVGIYKDLEEANKVVDELLGKGEAYAEYLNEN